MSGPREYDPEIKDIADYVANKPIDSELAVSRCPQLSTCLVTCVYNLHFTPRWSLKCTTITDDLLQSLILPDGF